eukprot:861862-Rhodomonas_salina.2
MGGGLAEEHFLRGHLSSFGLRGPIVLRPLATLSGVVFSFFFLSFSSSSAPPAATKRENGKQFVLFVCLPYGTTWDNMLWRRNNVRRRAAGTGVSGGGHVMQAAHPFSRRADQPPRPADR